MTAGPGPATGRSADPARRPGAESCTAAPPPDLPDATGGTGPARTGTCAAERELLTRVLSALLREDVVGLRSRSARVDADDGRWLRLPAGPGRALLLPVRDDGFQSALAARLPLLRREPGGSFLTTVDDVLDALAELAAPEDRPGFDAFAAECRADLLARRLHAATRQELHARLADRYGPDPARWQGHAASLAFDALAARADHPVYPASRARVGLTEQHLLTWAPEFHRRFRLRWLALPAENVVRSAAPGHRHPDDGSEAAFGAGRTGLFTPDEADLTPLAAAVPRAWRRTHVLLPVHPLAVGPALREALDATGLSGRAAVLEEEHLPVVPTLSMRTVALTGHPGTHVKLPLPTSTLGLLNRRTLRPGTLRDGAACRRLLARVVRREPRFHGRILLADESQYASAGHELLTVLIRRQPPLGGDKVVVPLAALAAPAPDGRRVLDSLADRFHGGDVTALLDALLTLLLDWGVTLFGYGVALESHPQNVSLVLGGPCGGTRLLFKDNDGPRIRPDRLLRAHGDEDAARLPVFDDPRLLVTDDGALADLFTTVTVHLCAGAWAFAPGTEHNRLRRALTDLVRTRLTEAVDRLAVRDRDAAGVLRARLLHAPELPVKAMVTAGTLLTKARSGAADINKHYTTGPNYLLRKA
ncbi:IucA/IucC family protein [Streptomyces hazeniae]|uniref:IucA/IucC family protein n=1 Tax=Streptomyces hazeniae TaxID=3075538 RepID=UPI00374E1234